MIPARNEATLIGAALASVADQTAPGIQLEAIVVGIGRGWPELKLRFPSVLSAITQVRSRLLPDHRRQ